MENLEIKGVRTPDDIKNVYLKAVEENIKFYRAVSNSGKYYGWETNVVYPQGHHIPAQAGQEWFINDKYVEPVEEPIEEVAENEPISEPEVEPVVEEPIVEEVEQPTEEPVVEPQEPDYKSLYEEALKQVDVLEEELTEQDKLIEQLKNEVETISNGFAEYRTVVENFAKLFRE